DAYLTYLVGQSDPITTGSTGGGKGGSGGGGFFDDTGSGNNSNNNPDNPPESPPGGGNGQNPPGSDTPHVPTPTVPVLTNAATAGSVDEGNLRSPALGGTDTFGTGNDSGPLSTGGGPGSLNALVDFGSDGPNATPFQFVSSLSAALSALNLHSHGM